MEGIFEIMAIVPRLLEGLAKLLYIFLPSPLIEALNESATSLQ